MPQTKLAEFCSHIYQLEQELNLPQLRIQNCYFWQLIRMDFYYQTAQKLNILNNPHPKLLQSSKTKVLWRALCKFPWQHLLLRNSKITDLIVCHSRKHQGKDMYSEKIIQQNPHICIADKCICASFQKNAITIDTPQFIGLFCSKIFKPRFSQAEEQKITEISQAFSEKFQTSINLKPLIEKRLTSFKISKKIYKLFFKNMPCLQKVYITVGHSHQSLISALKELHIQTTEVQHAVLSPYHLGYHFPKWPEVPYATDNMLTFGRFWQTAVNHPKSMHFEVIGSPLPLQKAAKHLSTNKQKQIIFISQGIVYKKLYQFAVALSKCNIGCDIIYRLHPSESINDYPLNANIQLSQTTPDTYSLLAEAEYAVGVASTAIYEACLLGCKPILFNTEGVEYLQPLIDQYNIPLVSTTDDFIKALKEAKKISAEAFYA